MLYMLSLQLSGFNLLAQPRADFEVFKTEIRDLWSQAAFKESLTLIESKESIYKSQDQLHTMLYYKALLFLEINEFERSFKTLRSAFEKGYFYTFWPEYRQKISNHPGGQKILDQNEEIRINFRFAKPGYEVILPANFSATHKYPVLYFFHGNNSNLESLRKQFKNFNPEREIIIVLAQSGFPRSNYTYDWIADEAGINNALAIHNELSKEYEIDSHSILAGGFSNGGRMAIELFLRQPFEISGFIAFNPSKAPSADVSLIEKKSGNAGVLITGENDYLLKPQINMADNFLKARFPLKFLILPGHDHNYPQDFSKYLNSSIQFIFDR